MNRLLTVTTWCGFFALATGVAPAQNLLINGDLELPPEAGADDAPDGWTLEEGPAANTANLQGFANNTEGGAQGLWYRGFEGTTFDDPREAVDADLFQDVPGTPGLIYTMTGWALFEENWAGGFDELPSGGVDEPPRWPEGTESPTRTEFALEFLDGGGAVLDGSVVVDLHDDLGQENGSGWQEHMLSATAPDGTVNVRVRASMVDGVNADLNPQSAFVDDFVLTAIPEPSAGALALLGLAGLGAGRRVVRRS